MKNISNLEEELIHEDQEISYIDSSMGPHTEDYFNPWVKILLNPT